MKISVVIPVYNGGADLGLCLERLAASSRRPDELIVVDDGSTDGSADLALRHGAKVVHLPTGPLGPATARNRGAAASRGDVLVFIDADVAVHRDTLERIESHLEQEPGACALFGSYDDDPPAPGLMARYKNLLHHHTHQTSRRESTTFWAGCGAVRREAFLACGGFDESFTRPSIEDIELGMRLRGMGRRVLSTPDALATHLKRWTFHGALRTDIFQRAIPWSRLIVRDGTIPNDLNLGLASRVAAVSSWIFVTSLVVGLAYPASWLVSAASLVLIAFLNRGLLRLLHRRGGLALTLVGLAYHIFYFLYSSLTFAAVAGLSRFSRTAAPPTPA